MAIVLLNHPKLMMTDVRRIYGFLRLFKDFYGTDPQMRALLKSLCKTATMCIVPEINLPYKPTKHPSRMQPHAPNATMQKWIKGALWLETVYTNNSRKHSLVLSLNIHYHYWARHVRDYFGADKFVTNSAERRAVIDLRPPIGKQTLQRLRRILHEFSRWWGTLRLCMHKTKPPYCGNPATMGCAFCHQCLLKRVFAQSRENNAAKRRRLD